MDSSTKTEIENYVVAKHTNEQEREGLASLAINETKSQSTLRNDFSPLEKSSKDEWCLMKWVSPALWVKV